MSLTRRSLMKSLVSLPVAGRKLEGIPRPSEKGISKYTIGTVGSPTTPDVRWSDEQLRSIKEAGVKTLQLSIA